MWKVNLENLAIDILKAVKPGVVVCARKIVFLNAIILSLKYCVHIQTSSPLTMTLDSTHLEPLGSCLKILSQYKQIPIPARHRSIMPDVEYVSIFLNPYLQLKALISAKGLAQDCCICLELSESFLQSMQLAYSGMLEFLIIVDDTDATGNYQVFRQSSECLLNQFSR